MRDLNTQFQELPLPRSESEILFSARPIDGFENHRIAKDKDGSPAVFIFCSEKNQEFIVTKKSLYNISIHFDRQLEIDFHGNLKKERFSVISFVGKNEKLKSYFLQVCELLLKKLGNNPTSSSIKIVFSQIVELFRVAEEPGRNSVQGLWAELFVIHQSGDRSRLIEMWHSIPNERFDFSEGQIRLEVKSTRKSTRAHHFSGWQLTPPSGCRLFVISIVTHETGNGMSIKDLWKEILLDKKVTLDQELKLSEIILSTLKISFEDSMEIHFDFETASDSLAIFTLEQIPRIINVPNGVSNVEYVSSLDGVIPFSTTLSSIFE